MKIRTLLYTNTVLDENSYLEDYKDHLEERNMTEKELPLGEYISDCILSDWENFCIDLEHCENNVECVIVGTLGLWNGRKTIIPTKCKTIDSAISKCVGGSDYVTIRQINGHIELECSHHDSTNTFHIYLLNDKGINTKRGDLSKKHYHKAIQGYIF